MIEIIAATVEDAINIFEGGGDRIELVSALSEGGLTPSYGLIKNVLKCVSIPVNVIIRPHAKSFVYSDWDICSIIEDVEMVKELGANGIVFGTLDENGEIDVNHLEQVLKHTGDLDITFHRAIDDAVDIINSIKILKEYSQINRVLSSGGSGNIENNTFILRKMIEESNGNITIMAGGGLNFKNVKTIISSTQVKEIHFGTAVREDNSPFKGVEKEKIRCLRNLIDEIS